MEHMSGADASSILSRWYLIVFTAEIQARLASLRNGAHDDGMNAMINRNTSMR